MLLSSTGSIFTYTWGGPGYQAVPGDYDGDAITDIAVYSAVNSTWSMLTSTTGFTSGLAISWGGPGYTPVPDRTSTATDARTSSSTTSGSEPGRC